MRRIAIDNNVLSVIVGIDNKVNQICESQKRTFDDVLFDEIYCGLSKRVVKNYIGIFEIYKASLRKELRIFIPPTVVKEIFDVNNFDEIKFRKSKVMSFFHNHCVEHISFDNNKQHLIDELTKKLLEPVVIKKNSEGFEFEKVICPISGNNNKNYDHDARILSECYFGNVNLVTMDSDFSDKINIYKTIQNFWKEHKEDHGKYKIRIFSPGEYSDQVFNNNQESHEL